MTIVYSLTLYKKKNYVKKKSQTKCNLSVDKKFRKKQSKLYKKLYKNKVIVNCFKTPTADYAGMDYFI